MSNTTLIYLCQILRRYTYVKYYIDILMANTTLIYFGTPLLTLGQISF